MSVPVEADQIGIEEGYGDDDEKPCNTLDVSKMRIIYVELADFHGLEAGLCLPTSPVGSYGFIRSVEEEQDWRLWESVHILHSCR